MSPPNRSQLARNYLALFFAAISISTAMAAESFDGSFYSRSVSLDLNLDVFWTIDNELETVRVAVHSKTSSGWAGIGVSEMGGMEGADIVYYEAATGNLTDAHTIVAGTPIRDECTQDWILLSAEVGTDGLVFEAERTFDTGDSQDRVFQDDSGDDVLPTRLLAAWGNEETITYHGSNFAKGEVTLFGGVEDSSPDKIVEMASEPSVSYFDLTAINFTIPTNRTKYETTCLTSSGLPALEEYHIIGIEGLIQNETSKYVHHFVVKAYDDVDDCGQSCKDWLTEMNPDSAPHAYYSSSSGPCDFSFSNIFIWAPGAKNLELPDDVGIKNFQSVAIETHYNNPDGDAGQVDNSGVRVYYTETLRPMDMGIMQLADPYVGLMGMPLPSGKSHFSFSCPSSCSEEYFEDESVTVFSHFLHMHENGQRLKTSQFRKDSSGNEFLVDTAEIEYYSFLQAGGHVTTANDSITIQRGDRFEIDCFYDTSLSSVDPSDVTFGFGSQDEMCIDYLFYYPIQPIPVAGACGVFACGGELVGSMALDDDSNFNRTFGTVDTCPAIIEEDFLSSSSATILPRLGLLVCFIGVSVMLAGASLVFDSNIIF